MLEKLVSNEGYLSKDHPRIETKIFIHDMANYKKHFYCCRIENEEFLLEDWSGLIQDVAVSLQSKLKEMIEKMNIYVFFMTKDSVNIDLRHNIESNTYSSRKIVLEKDVFEDDDELKKVLHQKVLTVDLAHAVDRDNSELLSELKQKDNKLHKLYTTLENLDADQVLKAYTEKWLEERESE